MASQNEVDDVCAKTGGKAKSPLNRRPSGYWAVFSTWWRARYAALGVRPTVNEVIEWYHENAATSWPASQVPSLKAVLRQSKGLRPIDGLKEYFREYRKKRKQQGGQALTVAGDAPAAKRRQPAKRRRGRSTHSDTSDEEEEEEEEMEGVCLEEDEEEEDEELPRAATRRRVAATCAAAAADIEPQQPHRICTAGGADASPAAAAEPPAGADTRVPPVFDAWQPVPSDGAAAAAAAMDMAAPRMQPALAAVPESAAGALHLQAPPAVTPAAMVPLMYGMMCTLPAACSFGPGAQPAPPPPQQQQPLCIALAAVPVRRPPPRLAGGAAALPSAPALPPLACASALEIKLAPLPPPPQQPQQLRCLDVAAKAHAVPAAVAAPVKQEDAPDAADCCSSGGGFKYALASQRGAAATSSCDDGHTCSGSAHVMGGVVVHRPPFLPRHGHPMYGPALPHAHPGCYPYRPSPYSSPACPMPSERCCAGYDNGGFMPAAPWPATAAPYGSEAAPDAHPHRGAWGYWGPADACGRPCGAHVYGMPYARLPPCCSGGHCAQLPPAASAHALCRTGSGAVAASCGGAGCAEAACHAYGCDPRPQPAPPAASDGASPRYASEPLAPGCASPRAFEAPDVHADNETCSSSGSPQHPHAPHEPCWEAGRRSPASAGASPYPYAPQYFYHPQPLALHVPVAQHAHPYSHHHAWACYTAAGSMGVPTAASMTGLANMVPAGDAQHLQLSAPAAGVAQQQQHNKQHHGAWVAPAAVAEPPLLAARPSLDALDAGLGLPLADSFGANTRDLVDQDLAMAWDCFVAGDAAPFDVAVCN